MKFTANRENLRKKLGLLSGIVTSGQVNPLLKYCRLRLEGNMLRFEGMSGNVEIQIQGGVEVEGKKDGECFAPFKELLAALDEAPKDSNCIFNLSRATQLHFTAGTAAYVWKPGGGIWPDYQGTRGEAYEVPGKLFDELLTRGTVAMTAVGGKQATDALTLGFQGQKLWAESINGHFGVQAVADMPNVDWTAATALLPRQVLAPLRLLATQAVEPIIVRIGTNRLELVNETARVSVSLVEGRLPSFALMLQRVQQPQPLPVETALLITALRRLKRATESKTVTFRFLADALQLIVSDELTMAQDQLPVPSKQTTVVHFAMDYWAQVLGAVRDLSQVYFGVVDEKSAAWVVGRSEHVLFQSLIMPCAAPRGIASELGYGRDALAAGA